MRALIQRVSRAAVRIDGITVGEIGRGLMVLVGVGKGDGATEAARLAKKVASLRIFPDAADKMNLSLTEVGGACLVVSQFTLFADTTRGRRPYFGDAAAPEVAAPLCEAFAAVMRAMNVEVATGRFGAMMQVELVNDGPVTLSLEELPA